MTSAAYGRRNTGRQPWTIADCVGMDKVYSGKSP
jgi:hypothetical protein